MVSWLLIRRDQRGFLTCRLQGNFVRRPGMWRCAERAVVIAHRDGPIGDDDFRVADGRRIFSVHAKAERPARWFVRTMQPAQPRQAARASLPPRFAGNLTPLALSTGFIVAGGEPVPRFPRVRHFVERVLIPAKLERPPFAWREGEQTEWRHVLLRQRGDGGTHLLQARRGDQRRHDDAATHAAGAGFTRNRIPVDQRKRQTGIVHTYPRASGRFRGIKGCTPNSGEALRWICRGAQQGFVTVHPGVEAAGVRQEGDGTH